MKIAGCKLEHYPAKLNQFDRGGVRGHGRRPAARDLPDDLYQITIFLAISFVVISIISVRVG